MIWCIFLLLQNWNFYKCTKTKITLFIDWEPTLSASFLIRFIDITHIRVQKKEEEKNMKNTYTNKNQTKLNIEYIYKCLCVYLIQMKCIRLYIFENPSHILSITKAVIVSNFIEKKRECVKYVQYHIHTAHIQIHTHTHRNTRTEKETYLQREAVLRCVTHKGYILNNIVRVASHCLYKYTLKHTYSIWTTKKITTTTTKQTKYIEYGWSELESHT